MDSKGRALLALIVTVGLFVFVPNTLLQALLCLLWWLLIFRPISRTEWVLVALACIGYTAADISVTSHGIFTFAANDLLGLPYVEPFVWGFYFLQAERLLGGKSPRPLWPGIVLTLLAIGASSLPGSIALYALGGVFVAALAYFHTRYDLLYAGYFVLIGISIEWLGTNEGLWTYHIAYAPLWWVLTWGLSGLILYRAALPVSAYLRKRLR